MASLMTAGPALAAPRASLPTVLSFTASPALLSGKGGTVTLAARTKNASDCVASVGIPYTVKGLPSTTKCTSQIFSLKVTVPANASGNAEAYVFSFYAKNPAGSSATDNASVSVGGSPPPLSFSPTSVKFTGTTAVGVPAAPAVVKVTNDSTTQSQYVTAVTAAIGTDASDFIVSQGGTGACGVYVSPTQSCTFDIIFSPLGTGKRVAQVEVEDLTWGTSKGAVDDINLSGNGGFGIASLSLPTIDWASHTISTEPDQGVGVPTVPVKEILTNTSTTTDLFVGAFPANGTGGNWNDFTLVQNTCQDETIDPGKTCTFQLEFDPLGSGTRASHFVIPDNTAQGQTVVTLGGTGAFANASYTFLSSGKPVTSIAFPKTAVGSYASVVLVMTNTSGTGKTDNVTLRSLGADTAGVNPGDFFVSANNCVGAGDQEISSGYCYFDIEFVPTTNGARAATAEIYNNTVNGSYQITLTGMGS